GEQQVLTFAAGPVRDFYLVGSDEYVVHSDTVGATTINGYASAKEAGPAQDSLEAATQALANFNQRIGPYPFTELDLAATPNLALGIEYPGVVVITSRLYDPDGFQSNVPTSAVLESTVAHEVAHQWFYSVVGNDQLDEPWLDESLVQYLTYLYYVDLYGPAGATGFHQSLEGRWGRVGREEIPIGLPVGAYDATEYSAIVYGRGPLFFETLEETMGQAAFGVFLRDYYASNQYGIGTGEEVKQLAEVHCACDLTALFEEWVYPD
ncbi:MAG: M1 family aminopeptidase, partial [Ardenticatenaceae bacterium]